MVEGFKITAQKLKRILKISVHLPKDYNNNDNDYPLVLALDGQLLFNFINENTQKINMADVMSNYNNFILISLHSPSNPAWRMSELNPYYKGKDKTVDTVLSYIYYDYIVNELLPLLKQRYRFNEEIYLLGFYEGAIASLYMVYRYNIFKGAALYSPTLSICDKKLSYDLEKNFTYSKAIYMYSGSKDTNTDEDTLFYNLYTRFEALKCQKLYLDYDNESNNDYDDIKKHLNNSFNFLLP